MGCDAALSVVEIMSMVPLKRLKLLKQLLLFLRSMETAA